MKHKLALFVVWPVVSVVMVASLAALMLATWVFIPFSKVEIRKDQA